MPFSSHLIWLPAHILCIFNCALLCMCTQTSKRAAGKQFCVNVIVLFKQCDKTATVLRQVWINNLPKPSPSYGTPRMRPMRPLRAGTGRLRTFIDETSAAERCGSPPLATQRLFRCELPWANGQFPADGLFHNLQWKLRVPPTDSHFVRSSGGTEW